MNFLYFFYHFNMRVKSFQNKKTKKNYPTQKHSGWVSLIPSLQTITSSVQSGKGPLTHNGETVLVYQDTPPPATHVCLPGLPCFLSTGRMGFGTNTWITCPSHPYMMSCNGSMCRLGSMATSHMGSLLSCFFFHLMLMGLTIYPWLVKFTM